MNLQNLIYKTQVYVGLPNPIQGGATLGDIVASILSVVLPLSGILFLGMVVYGGITYTTSAGDPGKVKSAQAMLTNATIGLAITVFAFAIKAIVENILSV